MRRSGSAAVLRMLARAVRGLAAATVFRRWGPFFFAGVAPPAADRAASSARKPAALGRGGAVAARGRGGGATGGFGAGSRGSLKGKR